MSSGLRWRPACRRHRRQTHAAQLRHQLLGNLSTEPTADLELLRRRRGGAGQLGRERRFGRHLGRVRREVMDDDALGPSELLALVALPLGDLGRGAAGQHDQGKQTGDGMAARSYGEPLMTPECIRLASPVL